jgi:hypothetical protein
MIAKLVTAPIVFPVYIIVYIVLIAFLLLLAPFEALLGFFQWSFKQWGLFNGENEWTQYLEMTRALFGRDMS